MEAATDERRTSSSHNPPTLFEMSHLRNPATPEGLARVLDTLAALRSDLYLVRAQPESCLDASVVPEPSAATGAEHRRLIEQYKNAALSGTKTNTEDGP